MGKHIDAVKALALELFGTDDLSEFPPGLVEWLDKEAESRGGS